MTSTRRLWFTLATICLVSFGVLGLLGRVFIAKRRRSPRKSSPPTVRTLFTDADIRDRPRGLAVDRRQAGRIDLGPRRLSRARLVGGLAAPGGERPCRRSSSSAGLRFDPRRGVEAGRSGSRSGARQTGDPHEQLQCRHWRDRRIPDSRRRLSGAWRDHYRRAFRRWDAASTVCARTTLLPENAMPDGDRRAAIGAFFFWTAWAAGTERPDHRTSPTRTTGRTRRWSATPATGSPSSGSVISVVLLLAGIGALAWYFARATRCRAAARRSCRRQDPLLASTPTPSHAGDRRSTSGRSLALLVVQVGLGAVTAH